MSALLREFDALSKAAPEPIYQQIKAIIRHRISDGDWPEGHKLPSENNLVGALGVSRMTVNRALRELAQEGLITRVHGLGSFVAARARHASLIELQDIASEIKQQGGRYQSRVLSLKRVRASALIAEKMESTTGSPLYYLRAMHAHNDLPMQLESRFVNPRILPEFIQQDFSVITSTAYLQQQFKPEEIEHRVRAVLPDAATRRWLSMEPAQPCLELTRRTWVQNQVVTYAVLTYPGDRYDLAARYPTDAYQPR